MDRARLEHAIQEVGRKIGLDYFYIVGSAAVFASIPATADPDLSATRDVDVIPSPPKPLDPEAIADRIDFLMGEGSVFEEEFGYYVQGVSMNTPTFAPRGWQERTVPVRAGDHTGLCMEIHDLAISKYGIGREKDLLFNAALASRGWLRRETLLERLLQAEMDDARVSLVTARIKADLG